MLVSLRVPRRIGAQQEIAEAVGCPQRTVSDVTKDFTDIGRLSKSGKPAAEHLTDFDPPIYMGTRTRACYPATPTPPSTQGSIAQSAVPWRRSTTLFSISLTLAAL